MKLIKIIPSLNPEKKYDAFFETDTGTKKVSFGARGMSDYLHHKDDKRRQLYLTRHRANENWNDPMTAGSLSRWILWGPSTSFEKNVSLFRKRFNL